MTDEEKRVLAIGRAVDRVRKELPLEFKLHIELASGEGNVALHSPNEGGSGLRNWEGDTLAAQIHMALTYATSIATTRKT
jgi:hypothetical protein